MIFCNSFNEITAKNRLALHRNAVGPARSHTPISSDEYSRHRWLMAFEMSHTLWTLQLIHHLHADFRLILPSDVSFLSRVEIYIGSNPAIEPDVFLSTGGTLYTIFSRAAKTMA